MLCGGGQAPYTGVEAWPAGQKTKCSRLRPAPPAHPPPPPASPLPEPPSAPPGRPPPQTHACAPCWPAKRSMAQHGTALVHAQGKGAHMSQAACSQTASKRGDSRAGRRLLGPDGWGLPCCAASRWQHYSKDRWPSSKTAAVQLALKGGEGRCGAWLPHPGRCKCRQARGTKAALSPAASSPRPPTPPACRQNPPARLHAGRGEGGEARMLAAPRPAELAPRRN